MNNSQENLETLKQAGKKVRDTGKDVLIVVNNRTLTVGYPDGLKIPEIQKYKKKKL